ncbi:MAG: PLP-dependent aminotransferase family protein, partial [Isosphaeraceae bacterium]
AAPDLISLAAGFVDHATLPVEAMARATASVLADPVEGKRALQYGTTIGDPHLRKRLVAHLEQDEKVAKGTFAEVLDRTVVTNGSQQLLYLVAEALLDPGDIVLVESPTYFVFMGVLRSRGARVIGVATDEGGLRLDALDATLAKIEAQGELNRVKLIYTISEHSNPTGLSLAADRRKPLVELAKRWSSEHRIFILEDSAYRGLTYEGTEPPSVWRHDPDGQTVILARTFSKTFSPGLRTGYGILPEALVAPVVNLKGNHDFGSSHFNQQVIERLIAEGDYARQVDRLRTTYRRKRDIFLEALDAHLSPLGEGISWTRPNGGLYVWLTLPDGIDTGRNGPLFARCLEHGVLYVPGAHAFADEPAPAPKNHARLTFGVTGEAGLAEGARRLASALAECLEPVA